MIGQQIHIVSHGNDHGILHKSYGKFHDREPSDILYGITSWNAVLQKTQYPQS